MLKWDLNCYLSLSGREANKEIMRMLPQRGVKTKLDNFSKLSLDSIRPIITDDNWT